MVRRRIRERKSRSEGWLCASRVRPEPDTTAVIRLKPDSTTVIRLKPDSTRTRPKTNRAAERLNCIGPRPPQVGALRCLLCDCPASIRLYAEPRRAHAACRADAG